MEDDTREPLTSPARDVMSDLALAAVFKISRKNAYQWATKGLKVLGLDGEIEPDRRKGQDRLLYDPEDPDDVERFAIALSLMNDEEAATAAGSLEGPEHKLDDSNTEATEKGRFSEDVASCPRCRVFSKFSRHRRVENFKLVQPWEHCGRELPTCDHFLAVSYCWSTFQDTERHYRIRDCTSTHGLHSSVYLPADRRVPPDEVLDRAVEMASEMGLRCIWIDQACLPQDQSDEHRIGVQAMDLVYQRAAWTLAILDSVLSSQEQLLALRVIQAWGDETRKWTQWPNSVWWSDFFTQLVSISPRTADVDGVQVGGHVDLETVLEIWLKHILDLLEFLSNDRWYTRAWTFQESLSSGENISVILRVESRVELPLSTGDHPRVWQIFPTIDPNDKVLSFTYMALQKLISDAHHFTSGQGEDRLRSQEKPGILAVQTERHGNNYIQWSSTDPERTRRIFSRLQALHPPRGKRIFELNKLGKSNFGPRMTLSSAAAISFLRTRQCLCAEDRIAIVANLCNYEIPLDSFQLSTRIKSLRICLFALSLSNGDFSLLTLDYYDLRQISELKLNSPSFLSDVFEGLHTIRAFAMDNYSLGNLRIVNLQKYVLTFGIIPGMMWSVSRTVDLSPVQRKWADEWWNGLNGAIEVKISGTANKKKDETRDQIYEYLSNPANATRIRQKLYLS
ncbi:heterokaryon incompatibility protein-domain-containing protein [Xylaria castorea]|nr:heterokaryon incompatibility protein-domain-containing protein [Xylaria castorea]